MSRQKKVTHTRVPLTRILRALADCIEASNVDEELLLPDGTNIVEQLSEHRNGCCGTLRFDPMVALVNHLCRARWEIREVQRARAMA